MSLCLTETEMSTKIGEGESVKKPERDIDEV